MKHIFIVNPVAGKGKAVKLIPVIRQVFKKNGKEYQIELTTGQGDAGRISGKYSVDNNCIIYSVGGDGTLNEVVNGMINSGSKLAIIPAGSGNDFYRSLGSQGDPVVLLERTIAGQVRKIDLGRVNNRHFINIASLGFDAEVAYTTNSLIRRIPFLTGRLAYITAIFSTLARCESVGLQIRIDDMLLETRALILAAANGRYYGGGILPAPEACINDGLFDICLIGEKTRIEVVRLLPEYIKGRHAGIEGVRFFRGKRIEVNCDKCISVNIDGEVERLQKAIFEIIPGGIDIVAPV